MIFLSRLSRASFFVLILIFIFPIGARSHFLPIAIIAVLAISIPHAVGYVIIKRCKTRVTALFVVGVVAYLIGTSAIGVGGLLWQVLEYGWTRTNVQGYLFWCWIYGFVFWLPSMAVSMYIFKPILPPPVISRGFEVLPHNSTYKDDSHKSCQP